MGCYVGLLQVAAGRLSSVNCQRLLQAFYIGIVWSALIEVIDSDGMFDCGSRLQYEDGQVDLEVRVQIGFSAAFQDLTPSCEKACTRLAAVRRGPEQAI